MNWKTLSSEYLYQHPPYFIARKDVCERPDGALIPAYYVVELPESVITFGVTEEGQVLVTEQYRHPINAVSIEFPGGFIDAGEEPLTAAMRETEEETGYHFEQYKYLGKVAGNPGILSNYTHLFLATGGKKVMQQHMDVQEDIQVKLLSVDELKELISNNQIVQSLHLNACMYALLHLQEMLMKK
jgi:ADP-ribose pyrophosphatase